MSKLEESLQRLFEQHRIVVWYDPEGDFSADFEAMELAGVQKLPFRHNAFALKYRMLIREPAQQFLLYADIARPEDRDNWLLDIELSNRIYHTDPEALALQELELPPLFRPWVRRHLEFFKSKERSQRYAASLQDRSSEQALSLHMMQQVLGAAGPGPDELLRAYAQAMLGDKLESLERELQRYQLAPFFWELIGHQYHYKSPNPGIYDFLLEVFQKGFGPTAGRSQLNHGAAVLLSLWKDARSFEAGFRSLSHSIEKDLNIRPQLDAWSIEELAGEDLFECIDQHIIQLLAAGIESRQFSPDKVDALLKQRESSHWYDRYEAHYMALRHANALIAAVHKYTRLQIRDYQDGFGQYTTAWYRIDQDYRGFLEHYRACQQHHSLAALYQTLHKVYSNTWLMRLSDAWQQLIDRSEGWYFGANSQRHFFQRAVKASYIDKRTTVFVVISDALRYECGEALYRRFNQESRFSARLEYMVTGLPSYTQLGMAALLPHTQLALAEGDNIHADGRSTAGLAARKKVLEAQAGVPATAILAEELMHLNARGEEAKALVQEHDVIYVYHNRIDKLGDDKSSEDKVVEAARDEIAFLVELARKIAAMNAYHIVITADHGFIYQHEALEESDFSDAQLAGDIIKDNRRFVLGNGLQHSDSVRKFSAEALKLQNEAEVLIPRGINRLRKQGAGSRYVHGGAMPQEVIVPLLYVMKARSDTVARVDIDVLKGNTRVTTNMQRVRFFQQQAVGPGFIPRSVKSYFCIEAEGQLKPVSDVFTYTFDSEAARAEAREVEHTFTLAASPKGSRQLWLLIEEAVEKSNKWNTLHKLPYTLSLTMENDFDDF